jgi:hypothetical protein
MIGLVFLLDVAQFLIRRGGDDGGRTRRFGQHKASD